MGFGTVGCGTNDKDSAHESIESIVDVEPSSEPPYGVPELDADGDGYFADEDDCNDQDPTIHPNAEETPGDGIDSNCNGNDNN